MLDSPNTESYNYFENSATLVKNNNRFQQNEVICHNNINEWTRSSLITKEKQSEILKDICPNNINEFTRSSSSTLEKQSDKLKYTELDKYFDIV